MLILLIICLLITIAYNAYVILRYKKMFWRRETFSSGVPHKKKIIGDAIDKKVLDRSNT